jgi:SAM-dependent methyltransferase
VNLDDPAVVRHQYATEAGLLARRSLYASVEGPSAPDAVFQAVAEVAPTSVLEVGCGPGELAARIAHELGAVVSAIDSSPRMVELALARGVEAQLADVQALPFADGSFDCVVAAWMLYHVPDLDRGLDEIRRVLRPNGRLVASTNSERHLAEARVLAGIDMAGRLRFSRENGEEALRRHFTAVERRDVDAWVSFADAEAVRAYVRSMVTMRHHAERVREFAGPLRAGARVAVFVAHAAG